jgi:hypothetical protein
MMVVVVVFLFFEALFTVMQIQISYMQNLWDVT